MSTLENFREKPDETLAELISLRHESCNAWNLAEGCFAELYNRHSRNMLAYLAARLPQFHVDDAHQVVFERVWRHLPEQFHGGNFRAWMYTIARNLVTDFGRKKTMDHWEDDTQFPDPNPPMPDSEILREEDHAILASCLGKLLDEESEIVSGRLRGEDYETICEQMGIKPSRAHKLYHQAKRKLEACVKRAMKQ